MAIKDQDIQQNTWKSHENYCIANQTLHIYYFKHGLKLAQNNFSETDYKF